MCSYCGSDSIDVMGRLLSEHEGISIATGRPRVGVHSGDPDGVDDARAIVLRLLWPHTAAEEAELLRILEIDEGYESLGRHSYDPQPQLARC